MESLVLLHIAQTTGWVTTVNPTVIGAACAALAAAAVAIWCPHPTRVLPTVATRRGRRRVVSAVATTLVFLALLPAVVPYDHLFTQDAHAEGADESVHATHCHVSPGTCSDAPVPSGPGQLLMGEPLIVAPAMLAILVAGTICVLVGISFRPETRPPLLSAV